MPGGKYKALPRPEPHARPAAAGRRAEVPDDGHGHPAATPAPSGGRRQRPVSETLVVAKTTVDKLR